MVILLLALCTYLFNLFAAQCYCTYIRGHNYYIAIVLKIIYHKKCSTKYNMSLSYYFNFYIILLYKTNIRNNYKDTLL